MYIVRSGGYWVGENPKSSSCQCSIIASNRFTLAKEIAELIFCLLNNSFLMIGVSLYTTSQTVDRSLLKSFRLFIICCSPLKNHSTWPLGISTQLLIASLSNCASKDCCLSISPFANRSSNTTLSRRYCSFFISYRCLTIFSVSLK